MAKINIADNNWQEVEHMDLDDFIEKTLNNKNSKEVLSRLINCLCESSILEHSELVWVLSPLLKSGTSILSIN